MPASKKFPIIFIVGPTAIGKTRIAIKLAKKINGEIISSDSMQIYKGMSILSQAATSKQKKEVPHGLIGAIAPEKEFSVANFIKMASCKIDPIIKKKKYPIIVGGSGLYVKALIDGLFPSPEADLSFRKKMQDFASKYSSRKLHDKLARVDPGAARSIHPNDTRRIVRALEIHHSTGRTMTELKAKTRGLKDSHDIIIFGLTGPRDEIYEKINSRVDHIFNSGVLKEVNRLRKRRLSRTAKAVLGYREILGYLQGESDLETAKETLKMNTRRFAKRQLTWFGADKRIRWFDVSRMSEGDIIRKMVKEIK